MASSIGVETERIDDVVLLLEMMKQMGLPEVLNRHLPRHGNQTGLDLGWVASIWLSMIISEGDHRKVTVQAWVDERQRMLEAVSGQEFQAHDFSDDRLSILLRRLSEGSTWSNIEQELNGNTIRLYDLEQKTVRLDATTVSGYHLVDEAGLFQFGHSKDDPNRAQVKVMMGVLDPLGLPIATQVVSGEQADDGLYGPAITAVRQSISQPHLLFVGDCKLSALETRGMIAAQADYYLSPLAGTGQTPALLQEWVAAAISGQVALSAVELYPEREEDACLVEGYELTRSLEVSVNGQLVSWTERVLVVFSPSFALAQQRGLESRLAKATEKLQALTPKPGPGKRQITDAEVLKAKAEGILKQHRVQNLLTYEFTTETKSGKTRYVITAVTPEPNKIQAQIQQLGWRAYGTNAPKSRLSWEDAIITYRDEWIVEHSFSRLKGKALAVAPLFLQRDDQVIGLINLMSLALRLLALIEFVVRRNLKEPLKGLKAHKPQEKTSKPTAESLLKAFSSLTLTIIQIRGEQVCHVTELSSLQQHILLLLELPPDIYSKLGEDTT
jgi:transposase